MVEAIPSISTISTSVTDQDRVAVMKESGLPHMTSWSISYWDVFGLGVRQLLVASSESLKSSNSLSQDVYSAKSCITIDRCFQSLHKVQPSNSAEEFIACSKYELNDIDEDDYVFETVDNEIRAETLFSGSSDSSDTGSDSADSTSELEALPQEEHITQFEAEHGPDEVQDIVRVNLPSAKRVYKPLTAPSDTSVEHLEGPEILSMTNITIDCELPDTTILRLPGMRSRLEVTRITWIREVPLLDPNHSHEYERQEGYISANTRNLAHQPSSTVNHPRSRAISDPFLPSSQDDTSSPSPCFSYIPPSAYLPRREDYEDPPISVPSLCPPQGHSVLFAALDHPRLYRTPELNSAVTLSHSHDAACDRVTRPIPSLATHVQTNSSLHSGYPIISPTSALAGPSKTLLDILNGSFTDTRLPSNALPHVQPANGLGSSQDPPVFKPKPIGSASYSGRTGHRRLSDSSAGDVLYSSPVTAPERDEQAPPWPPVLVRLTY